MRGRRRKGGESATERDFELGLDIARRPVHNDGGWLHRLTMTRASRFGAITVCAFLVYFLFLFGILHLPFVSDEVSDAILPTVRATSEKVRMTKERPLTSAAALVGAGKHGIIPALPSWMGSFQLS